MRRLEDAKDFEILFKKLALRGHLAFDLVQQAGGLAAFDSGDVVLMLQQQVLGVVDRLGL